MQVVTFKPVSSELRRYIECFYILQRSAKDPPVSYVTFPSIFTIVVVSQNTKTLIRKKQLIIQHDPGIQMESKLVANFNKPVLVRYQGAINEITIYFKPLGINAFLNAPLNNFQKGDYSDFQPFADYEKPMLDALSIKKHIHKINAVEQYWLTKLKKFEHPFLPQMLDAFAKTGGETSVTGWASILKISRVTITKEFRKYLGLTPGHYKKILRLRQSISKQKREQTNRLSDLTYALDYFDQSHMIRDFKALTGMPPKKFFNEIAHIDTEFISWKFIREDYP